VKKPFRLGIDLGGTHVKMALVDGRGRIVERRTVDTLKEPRALVASLRSAAAPWIPRGIAGTGVAVAGDVDPSRGVVRFSPNLGWKNVRLAALFKKEGFPSPLRFENDATAAAWGAHRIEIRGGCRNLIVLTLGTGVGGGLVFDGRLYRGATGTAGEAGHMTVEFDGDPCACGRRGCLETYMGGAALVRWANARYAETGKTIVVSSPKELADRARGGDPVAKAAWARGAIALGAGLANLVNLLNPDVILLSGGLTRSEALFLPEARRGMRRRAFQTPARAVRLRVSRRSADLGVIGAALLEPAGE
jgi:glucokinase